MAQEIRISGVVQNVNKDKIERASIILFDSNENAIAYIFSNEQGIFTLIFQKKDTAYKLIISSLGFQKQIIPIDVSSKTEFDILVVLSDKTETLNEVILYSTKRNDTTKIKVQEYINETEQTVEDILKKIPGIEVLEDGSIKAHGKFIDKLLVEGDDILAKNYKLLSKNLDAKVLDAVEILDNFEDNPVLKKLFESEKVALNLKLKKDKQNIWFGNVNLGAGVFSENPWKEGINLGLLRKKIKFFYFGDYNNSGEKATNILAEEIYEDNFFGEDRYEKTTKQLYEINSNENTSLGKTQSIFNKALLNSLNFTTKLKQNLTLRGVTYVANDNQLQNSFSQSQYNIEAQPIVFTEDNQYKNNKTLAGGEIEAKYYPNDRNYFTNTFIYKNNPNTINSTILFNANEVSQDANRKNQTIYNHLRHTFTLSRKTIISNYAYFGNDNKTNTNKIKSPFLNAYLNADVSNFVNQDFDNTLQYYGFKSKLLSKYKKLDYSLDVNYENNIEKINSTFIVGNTNNETYQNNIFLKQNLLKSTGSVRFHFTKEIYFSSSLNYIYNNFNLNESKNTISIINPSAQLNYNVTKSARLGLNYSKNNTIPDVSVLLLNPILTNYRSFTTGTKYQKPLENNSISLNYYLLKDAKRYVVSATISYSDTKATIGSENQLNSNFSFSNYIYTKGGKNYSGNASFTKYFRGIKSSFKMETGQNYSENLIKINTTEFQTLKNYFAFYKFTGRSYLTGSFNFDFTCTYNESQSNFNFITSKNNTKDIALNVIFKPKETVIFELSTNYYNINSENYYFTNGVISYNPKASKFSYRMVLNNLFNRNEFTTVSISDYTSYIQSIPLLPRYILLNVKYRF